ncbi:universal stress protein [Acidisoma sp. 7E03]
MAQTLLALLDRVETVPWVLQAAAEAAARLGDARVVALAIRHPATEGLMPTEEVAGPAALERRDATEASRIAAIRTAFEACGVAGTAASFQVETGETEAVIARLAQPHEVLVIGHAPGAARDAAQAMDVALFSLDLPSLFVPAGSARPFGRHIAIAWKPSPAAERAVTAAQPLLLKAEQVDVLMIDEGEAVSPPPLAEVGAAGVAVRERRVRLAGRSVGRALLDEAHAAGADLLVMGAYTHARWAECLLGGATREILQDADLPVLMQH